MSGVNFNNTQKVNCLYTILGAFLLMGSGLAEDFEVGILKKQEALNGVHYLAKKKVRKTKSKIKTGKRRPGKRRPGKRPKRKYKRGRGSRCPRDMVFVYSRQKRIKVCVDKYELSYAGRRPISRVKPLGYRSQISCMRHCRKRKKRLLNNREWLIACEGTRPRFCNIYRSHPIIRKVKSKRAWIYRGVNCKKGKRRWSKHCMSDPSLNRFPQGLATNKGFSKCVSKYGVYNMVGNLGEWVAGSWLNKKKERMARFNGGLYPQRKSSCTYSTVAHGPAYRDYSIGCRCGQDPFY